MATGGYGMEGRGVKDKPFTRKYWFPVHKKNTARFK